MARRRLHVLCATVVMTVALPATAEAVVFTRVAVNDGLRITQVNEEAVPSEDNETLLTIRSDAPSDTVIFAVTGTTPEPGTGCSTMSATEISCPNPTTGRIRIFTGRGHDVVSLEGVTTRTVPIEVHGGQGNDRIVGSSFADTLTGDGSTGNGSVPGAGTPDALAGEDVLIGGPQNDTLFGGAGDDVLLGSALAGGPASEANILDGGDDEDVFDLGVSLGADEVRAGEGGENADGQSHINLPFSLGNTGAFTKGDVVTYERRSFTASGTAGVTADLDVNADDGAAGEGDLLGNVENIVGTARDDVLAGNGEANRLIGKLGKDRLSGLGGDDSLRLVDGIEDACPNGGTGTNEILSDLADQPIIEACTPPPTTTKPTNFFVFTPVDETTKPATIGEKLNVRETNLRVVLKCPRSPHTACAGTLAIAPLKGGKRVRQIAYRVPVRRKRTVTLRVGKRGLARLRKSGGAELTLVHQGKSEKGPTTVRVVRRVPAD